VSSPSSSLNDLICGFRSSASVHWKYFSLVFGCAGGGIVVVVYLDLDVAICWCSGREVLFLRLLAH
jgi:hypothetical protein